MTPKERRLTLANFLEHTVKPALDGARFDMRNWGLSYFLDMGMPIRNSIPSQNLVSTNGLSQLSECGFAGCAVGWGYYCPELEKEGIPVSMSFYGLVSDYEKLAVFFFGSDSDIDCENSEYVFSPDNYENPKDIDSVILRLREM